MFVLPFKTQYAEILHRGVRFFFLNYSNGFNFEILKTYKFLFLPEAQHRFVQGGDEDAA